MRGLYTLILYLLAPLVFLRLAWRGRANPAYRRRWGERLGLGPAFVDAPRIWLHAVSVGEVVAAAPLIRRLLEDYPAHRLLVTTTTPTGSDELRRRFGEAVEHVYLPFDWPGAVRRFLDRARPRLALVMETELWPNLFHGCRRRGIPLLLLNARLSARSARGYARLGPLTREVLGCVDGIAAREGADAERFVDLGAPPGRVAAVGNIKFDLEVPAEAVAEGARLRQRLGDGRPVWVAASTHSGEDEVVLAAHRRLRVAHPDALLVLVPRHPERFDAVADRCAEAGWPPPRRSRDAWPAAGDPVYLGDTMGELPRLFAAADCAFVGGSLVAVGGHNPLEPAALGLPVLTGPHWFNFAGVYPALMAAGGAREVADAGGLAAALGDWFDDAAARHDAGARARGVVEANRGTLERLLERIGRELGE